MLGEFTGEDKSHSDATVSGCIIASRKERMVHIRSLDFTRRYGGLLVVGSKLGCLSCNALEDIYTKHAKLVDTSRRKAEAKRTYH